jgi:hypothetical protein
MADVVITHLNDSQQTAGDDLIKFTSVFLLHRKALFCEYTATKIPFLYSFSGPSLSPNFNIHVSVTDLYIPRISLHIS